MLKSRIELVSGDITKMEVDAIVNAANTGLMGGGGVDAAIHRAAGFKLHEECVAIIKMQGICPTGESVITSGGNMQARYVIHTVGPVWHGGSRNEKDLLIQAYKSSLKIALKNKVKSIAYPNISTGIYGFPKVEAAEIAIGVAKNFLNENDLPEKIIFVCFEKDNYDIYYEKLKEWL